MAGTKTASSQQNGVTNRALFTFTTTAATAAATIFNVGFQPTHIVVADLTNLAEYEWFEGMAADSYIKTITAGTRSQPSSAGVAVATPTTGITVAAADNLVGFSNDGSLASVVSAAAASTTLGNPPIGTSLGAGAVRFGTGMVPASSTLYIMMEG